MTQLGAIFLDAYRELNSRKLFWIVLGLSGLFVVMYASIGFDEQGMFVLFGFKRFESDLLAAGTPMSRLLYRGIFATFVVPIWLGWIACILALISTAPIFPEFVASGSIDLVLCKPMARTRLFLCKYVASLLFVLLQVSIFCTGVFLAMGWRLGDWDWKVFAAIPLVTLFYSYLYSICVFVGIWKRSTLAALLLTFLVWFGIYSSSATEAIVVMIRSGMEVQADDMTRELEATRREAGDEADDAAQQWSTTSLKKDRDQLQEQIEKLDKLLKVVRTVRLPMPKTSETLGLLDRLLSREGDINLMDLLQGRVRLGTDGKPVKMASRRAEDRAQERMMKETDRSTPLYIFGTSLAFELVMLTAACVIFVRRDY